MKNTSFGRIVNTSSPQDVMAAGSASTARPNGLLGLTRSFAGNWHHTASPSTPSHPDESTPARRQRPDEVNQNYLSRQ
jgi:hypothetical protein